MERLSSFEDIAKGGIALFHSGGHLFIGEDCGEGGLNGTMWSLDTSARDPIFYRLHSFLEDIIQEFRDTKHTKYVNFSMLYVNIKDDLKV